MIVYMITILSVSITSLFSQYFDREKKTVVLSKIFTILTAIILITVAGLRWRVGTDYWSYARNYTRFVAEVLESIKSFNEPGIKIISFVSSLIYDDYATMFFICSLITVGLTVWTISKYSNSFYLSILMYIFIGSWHGSFNGVRQYLAAAILFAGHRYIIDKKFRSYLFIVLLASSFHISALSMIILYFIPKTRLNFKQIISLILVVVISLFLYNYIFEIINSVFESNRSNTLVVTEYVTNNVNPLRVLVMIAPLIVYLFITPKNKLNIEDNFYINLLYINAAMYIVTAGSTYLARFNIFTTIFITLAFPRLFKGVDKKTTIFVLYIALLLYSLFWSYEILITENLVNFQWIFER